MKHNKISLVFLAIGLSVLSTRYANSPTPQQSLPLSKTVTIGASKIYLEVARTPQQLSIGLMGRSSLPSDRGMLFEIGEKSGGSFWMKGMAIPIDIIFLQKNKVVAILHRINPCTEKECPLISQSLPFDTAIELNANQANRIKVGDILKIDDFK